MFGIQFYPTPPDLVQKMIEKVDFEKVSYILEPSAGKGDIIEGFRIRSIILVGIRYCRSA